MNDHREPSLDQQVCQSCRFSRLRVARLECHKRPPVADQTMSEAVWPSVRPHDWCGDYSWNYQLKAEKP